jgi:hypothetical protein
MKNPRIFLPLILVGVLLFVAISRISVVGFKPDHLVNISSVLTLSSFTVSSILTLRLLAIGAQLTFIPYCLLQDPPLWTPVIWNLLFLGVNIVNLIILLLQRRPVKLNADEQKLYEIAFKDITKREFLKLVYLGEWRSASPGEILMHRDQVPDHLIIASEGELIAVLPNQATITLPAGKLVGAPSAFVNDPMLVDIMCRSRTLYLSWEPSSLKVFLAKRPELRAKMKDIVSLDLIKSIEILTKEIARDIDLPEFQPITGFAESSLISNTEANDL